MITINNLDFHYPQQAQLLESLTLHLQAGKIHGLLGKNGEGKSTLLKLISGLLFPINGEIKVMDFDPQKRQTKLLQSIFFLPEEISPISLSLKRFVKTYAPFYPKFRLSRFYDYINDFGIDPLTKNIDNMSYGQKKKFMIAFGLSTNAKIILMDEPTNGLDIPSKGIFRRIVAKTIDEGCTIIISSHQVLDLEDLLHKIIIMEDHEILFNQSIENILKNIYFNNKMDNNTTEKVIYEEETIKGLSQICENKSGKISSLDIELLFKAVIAHKDTMKKIFEESNN